MEVWKALPGWEKFYEVSNLGRVRSLDRVVNYGRHGKTFYRGRILKGIVNSKGYKVVGLSRRRQIKIRYVHQLVLETFLGPRPRDFDTCHTDGNKTNNKLDNLRYDTVKNNVADSIRHGSFHRGAQSVCAKLTVRQVLEIRRNFKNLSSPKWAKKFGVSKQTILSVINRRTYVGVE